MNEVHLLIMVAGYRDLELARHGFAALRYEVEPKRFKLRAAFIPGLQVRPRGRPRPVWPPRSGYRGQAR